MVLSPPARLAALTVLLLGACIGTRAPERLATPTPIAVHVWLDGHDGAREAPPRVFLERLDALLRERNLVPIDVALTGADVAGLRTTRGRLDALLATAPEPGHALLVEVRASFFSQLSGRYRWEVDMKATLAARADVALARVETAGVAAFLQYEHEREPDALAFVTRQLASSIGELVDQFFEGSPRTSP